MQVVKKIKTRILCAVTMIRNRATYEIMSKSVVKAEKPQTTIWLRPARWISKAIQAQRGCLASESTHARTSARASLQIHACICTDSPTRARTQKYERPIALPRQKRACVLRHRYIAFRVVFIKVTRLYPEPEESAPSAHISSKKSRLNIFRVGDG
jgi:hypothetical protein